MFPCILNDRMPYYDIKMGLINRTIGFKGSNTVKLQLLLVQLEYCNQVWRGLGNENTIASDKVHGRATRNLLNFPTCLTKLVYINSNYYICMSYFRRDIYDLVFFHRCLYQGVVNVNNFGKFTHNNIIISRESVDFTRLCTPFCRTQSYQNIF